ncbi:hypothetical protein ACVFYP_23105 [Roseomonas sp. F4]
MNTLAQWILLPAAVQAFRRHPKASGWWLFKEGWPWRGVWAIHGSTNLTGNTILFELRPIDWLNADPPWLAPIPWLWITVARRRWLKKNAHRMPRALWRQARPLYPPAPAA